MSGSAQRSVTRQQLHQLVWEQPIALAAARLGVNSRALRNLCRQLAIPFPKQIYWQRKSAGLPVVSFQLPEAPPGVPGAVLMQIPETVSPQTQGSRSALHAVHPLVSDWQQMRDVGGRASKISTSERRRLDILNTIFTMWEGYGHAVEAERPLKHFTLRFEEVRIKCVLRERRTRHQESRHGYNFRSLRPSGRLIFLIGTFVPSKLKLKREWRDSDERLLEDAMPEIVQTLLAAGPIIAQLERKRGEENQRYEEERLLLRKREEQRRLDDRRWAVLLETASLADVISQLERLLGDLEATAGDLEYVAGDRTLREWLAWCGMRCQELDPRRLGLKALFEGVAKTSPQHSR